MQSFKQVSFFITTVHLTISESIVHNSKREYLKLYLSYHSKLKCRKSMFGIVCHPFISFCLWKHIFTLKSPCIDDPPNCCQRITHTFFFCSPQAKCEKVSQPPPYPLAQLITTRVISWSVQRTTIFQAHFHPFAWLLPMLHKNAFLHKLFSKTFSSSFFFGNCTKILPLGEQKYNMIAL